MKTLTKGALEVFILKDRKEMGQTAAAAGLIHLKDLLKNQNEVNVIFAAAHSQDEMYAGLLADPDVEWARVNAFHMDNYIGLTDEAGQQFTTFLRERLFSKLPFASIYYMGNTAESAAVYEALLMADKPDLCFMGVGENGHIAFNDPDNALFDDPQLVKLVELDLPCRMQQVHEGNFKTLQEVPTHALTLTIPALLKCKHLNCTVPGKNKAEAIKNMLEGGISETCPASILRRHTSAMLFLDEDVASLLTSEKESFE